MPTPVLIIAAAAMGAFLCIAAAYAVSERRRRARLLRQRSRGTFASFSKRDRRS